MDPDKTLKAYKRKEPRMDGYSNVFVGGGGSNSVVIVDKYATKIVPIDLPDAMKCKPMDNNLKEIEMARAMTKLVVAGKTPHIVMYLDSYPYKLSKLFNRGIDINELIDVKGGRILRVKTALKLLEQDVEQKRVKPVGIALVMEKCPHNLHGLIDECVAYEYDLKWELLRAMFQITYTLAVIQRSYPQFVHNDFHPGNVMGTVIRAKPNEYAMYAYGGRKFYVPIGGFCVKISDFGFALAPPELTSDIYKYVKDGSLRQWSTYDCKICDMAFLLGVLIEDLGMWKMKMKQRREAFNIINRFVDAAAYYEEIGKPGRGSWAKFVPKLAKFFKTPDQYMNELFIEYEKLPEGGKVVHEFLD